MNSDGSEPRQVTSSPLDKRDPTWVPEESRIIFRNNNGQLFGVKPDGNDEKPVLGRMKNINNPFYSPATKDLFFVSYKERPVDSSDVWKSDLNGHNPRLLTRGGILKYQVAVAKQGDKAVFVQADPDQRSHNLWLMNTAGNNLEQMTFGEGRHISPSFSPDGKIIIFASNHLDHNYEIYSLELTSKKMTRLTQEPRLDAYPNFSPDGQKIIFVSNRSGTQQLWVMDQGGQNPQPITTGNTESVDPVWVEEGK